MNCEIVAVGTELLLGASVDTNSSYIGERLAENGVGCVYKTVVGDNRERMTTALNIALERSDAVIVTGGLGPTQDDITRESLSDVMDAPLVLDDTQRQAIAAIFASRQRKMTVNNERQAWRPKGSSVIEQRRGTAPGLVCPVEDKVIFALPGVPFEMKEMLERAVLPELRRRAGEASVIVSRTLRTWGVSESELAEMVAPRIDALDAPDSPVTLAFLAHGMEGIHVRATARAAGTNEAKALLDAEEVELRTVLGPLVFGIDGETMESAVAALLQHRQQSLSVAESLTGGLIASRLTAQPGGSAWFKGGVVSYASEVKHSVLSVSDDIPVVSAQAAAEMAGGVRQLMNSDVGLGITGVAGPTSQENQPVGLVYGAIATANGAYTFEFRLSGDRRRIREFACINLLDRLRRMLLLAK